MYALFFSKAADKIYYYQVGWDKSNEQGFFVIDGTKNDVNMSVSECVGFNVPLDT